jgi:glycosyltransferase involved in cell wall biosynthesis
MRVAIVAPAVTDLGVPGLPEVRGGAERFASALAVALAKSGVHVDLVTFGREHMELRHHSGLGIRVLPRWSWRGDLRDPVNPALLQLASRYDVVHAHVINKAAVLLALGASIHKTKVILTPHGGGTRAGIRRGVWKVFDGSLFVSKFSRTSEPELARLPSDVIYGGGDALCPRHIDRTSGYRGRFLFVGRLTPHKGVDVLIQALPPAASLTIVGPIHEKDYFEHLRRLAVGKDVEFQVDLDDDELCGLYANARALILPSVELDWRGRHHGAPELLPLVLLEAMYCGTPVVASNVGGVLEAVDDGGTGFVVEPGNIASLRKVLGELAFDDDLVQTMGDAARTDALRRFTWSESATNHLKFYERLCET